MTDTATPIWTLSQLLWQRALDDDQTPLIAFPKSKQGVDDFEPISGATLNRFVDGTAKCLMQKGFSPVEQEIVVGICAATDLNYIVNIFALIRLGYTPFQISPRLPPSAVKALLAPLQDGGRGALIHATDYSAAKLEDLDTLELHQLVTREEYDCAEHVFSPVFEPNGINDPQKHRQRCIILHSSGSTGLPKPIDYNHEKLLQAGKYAQDATAFITMPFSHALGMMSYMQSISKRRTMYAMSGHVAQTHTTVTAAITAAKPEIIWTVPYVLKLLAEKPDGIEAIKNCKFVSSGGSKLPDELGNMLTEAGVHVGMQFGSTETGLIMSSAYRPREDKAWNYLRPPPHVLPYIQFRHVSGDNYECVILDGHRGKTMSNSDDPPNSWRTSDIFEPHSTIPNAWKFISRMDDRITLLNGEKVLPLTIEGRIRQHALVKEAVMFGIDREVPGVLLFKATGTSQIDDATYLDEIWPTIEYANSHAEAFSQITREMVVIIPEEVECPSTDKNSIKRGLVYKEFAAIIEDTYTAAAKVSKEQSLNLSIPELEEWILDTVRSQGYNIKDATTGFFEVGMDSLQAIRLRWLILSNIDLGGQEDQCAPMVVYDCGNAEKLARRLFAIRTGDENAEDDEKPVDAMQAMINKYSYFSKFKNHAVPRGGKDVVMLTGATGFLGGHILAALADSSNVGTIYALIRRAGDEKEKPIDRLRRALQSKGFDLPLDNVIAVYHDLCEVDLGIQCAKVFYDMFQQVTHVIHCSWAVNFAIPFSAFEPQLLGLHNLLSFSMQSNNNARLMFCSSIGVAQSTPAPAVIPSASIESLESCGGMGYGQSKLAGERIVEAAIAQGANATVLRIGQIIPGRRRGSPLWNPSEAIPLLIRAASKKSIASLPLLEGGRDACDWLEADVLADTVLQLAAIDVDEESSMATKLRHDNQHFYNLVNPQAFSWKDDLLPALNNAGLEFETVPWKVWLEKLSYSTDDARVNPSRKLLAFWSKQAQREGELAFDTAAAESASTAFRGASRAVDDGFMTEIVNAWGKYYED